MNVYDGECDVKQISSYITIYKPNSRHLDCDFENKAKNIILIENCMEINLMKEKPK